MKCFEISDFRVSKFRSVVFCCICCIHDSGESVQDEWGEDAVGEQGATIKDKDAVAALETSLKYLEQHGADLKDIAVIKYWLHFASFEASNELASS